MYHQRVHSSGGTGKKDKTKVSKIYCLLAVDNC